MQYSGGLIFPINGLYSLLWFYLLYMFLMIYPSNAQQNPINASQFHRSTILFLMPIAILYYQPGTTLSWLHTKKIDKKPNLKRRSKIADNTWPNREVSRLATISARWSKIRSKCPNGRNPCSRRKAKAITTSYRNWKLISCSAKRNCARKVISMQFPVKRLSTSPWHKEWHKDTKNNCKHYNHLNLQTNFCWFPSLFHKQRENWGCRRCKRQNRSACATTPAISANRIIGTWAWSAYKSAETNTKGNRWWRRNYA